MRLSVVIPARNEAPHLPHLLRALAAQTRPPDEVIVVDNASSDGTGGVARYWGERLREGGLACGVRVLHCPQPGVAGARQLGLQEACGDWVVSTDADSAPVPDWLQRLEVAMQPGVSALYGPLRLQPLAGRVGEKRARHSERGYRVFLAFSALLGRPNCAGANMAVLRTAALALGGYPAVEAREDVLLGLKLRQAGRVRYVPGALVHTSARRLAGGWRPFLLLHLRNLAGRTSGYFERPVLPDPAADRPAAVRPAGTARRPERREPGD